MTPSWIRSPSVMPCVWYRRAIETTSRRLRGDHPLLGGAVTALDPLRELDLLGGGEQRVAAGLVQELLQRVGRQRRLGA